VQCTMKKAVPLHFVRCEALFIDYDWDIAPVLGYYNLMNIAVSLIVVLLVLVVGLAFALFPRWWMRIISRSSRSYMKEDLFADPAYVLAFRFYGIAAVVLGLYALYQVLQVL